MRHSATYALFERSDVIIVASVSCIYGLGSPEAYHGMLLYIQEGDTIERDEILAKLVEIQYERNDIDFHRGTFRARGDVIEIFPSYSEERAIRISMFGDEVESIQEIDPLKGEVTGRLGKIAVYPKSHYVVPKSHMERAMRDISIELEERVRYFQMNNRLIEAQRIEQRTNFDVEMIKEVGYCQGIENYSRHLTGSKPGDPPPTLMDYFPKDSLVIIDESHVTVPQIGGMFEGDRVQRYRSGDDPSCAGGSCDECDRACPGIVRAIVPDHFRTFDPGHHDHCQRQRSRNRLGFVCPRLVRCPGKDSRPGHNKANFLAGPFPPARATDALPGGARPEPIRESGRLSGDEGFRFS